MSVKQRVIVAAFLLGISAGIFNAMHGFYFDNAQAGFGWTCFALVAIDNIVRRAAAGDFDRKA